MTPPKTPPPDGTPSAPVNRNKLPKDPHEQLGRKLSLEQIRIIARVWRRTGSRRATARQTGFSVDAVDRYLDRGDPLRGLLPITTWPQGTELIPLTQPLDAPAEAAGPGGATPLPGAPGAASAGPFTGQGGVPLGATPGAMLNPLALLVPPGHTVPAANGELVRASRGARTIFGWRNRVLLRMADALEKRGDLAAKDGPRLTRSERDMLVLLREAGRVTAQDVERLYRREVEVLGIAPPNEKTLAGDDVPDDPSDLKTLEDLRVQMQELLDGEANAGRIRRAERRGR